jgi:hypothetical protein
MKDGGKSTNKMLRTITNSPLISSTKNMQAYQTKESAINHKLAGTPFSIEPDSRA